MLGTFTICHSYSLFHLYMFIPLRKCITITYMYRYTYIIKPSALWADDFKKLKCPSVCLFVCLFVRLFAFEVQFRCLFAPPKVGCPIFLDIRNSWGKSNGKSGLTFENFTNKRIKIATHIYFSFL